MKKALLIAAVCCAAIVALAAQNRGDEGQRPRPVSRLVAALDADHDGTISATELRSSAAALRTLDADGDGQLTPEELRPPFGGRRDGEAAFGGRRGRGGEDGERGGAPAASADDLTDTLMAFDRNNDGRLDRAEVPERFQGLFDRADANKDSALTRDELKQSASATVQEAPGRGRGGEGRREFGRGRGGMFDPLMRVLDTDRDGALSGAEIAGAAAALTALDANQDGQLSSEEFRPVPPRDREGRR
jgi:Ca2+-binding EF-hand superfamily protein